MILHQVKNYIFRVTIIDSIQKNGLIYCAYDPKLFLRRHNLPNKTIFFLPSEILASRFIGAFDTDEIEFIKACDAFNITIKYNICDKKISKISMGENIVIYIQDIKNPTDVVSFEFNEKKFTGLMIKYKKPDEIRRMIKELFLRRSIE